MTHAYLKAANECLDEAETLIEQCADPTLDGHFKFHRALYRACKARGWGKGLQEFGYKKDAQAVFKRTESIIARLKQGVAE